MSVFVAVIPEGLPVSVTLSLTIIAKALGKNKVLCKSLTTVETLGAVNVLCSDKTGTLTQNKMFVQDASILDTDYSTSQAHAAILKDSNGAKVAFEQLQLVAGLCNAAQFDAATLTLPVSQRRINGDATDSAILRFAAELGDIADLTPHWIMKFDLPFNSKNKYMVNPQSDRIISDSHFSRHTGFGENSWTPRIRTARRGFPVRGSRPHD
jgi:sodium/potassium-transporting ATPase subunit alpha